jgi:HEPN domain-containing protein
MLRSSFDPLVLIRISQKDFEAAKLLFREGLYPQALYLLQQSLEKAAKALLLNLGIIKSEKEARKRLGHQVATSTVAMIVDELRKVVIRILATQLSGLQVEAEEIHKELTLRIIKSFARSYEDFLKGKEELFKTVEEIKQRAFDQINTECEKRISDLMDKAAELSFFKTFVPEEVVKLLATVLRGFGLSKEQEDKLLLHIHLATLLSLILVWHTPFEYNLGALRYRYLNVDERTFLVYWGRSIIEYMEKEEMLKRLEEFLEGKKTSKYIEMLDAIKKYLSSLNVTPAS